MDENPFVRNPNGSVTLLIDSDSQFQMFSDAITRYEIQSAWTENERRERLEVSDKLPRRLVEFYRIEGVRRCPAEESHIRYHGECGPD